MLYKHLRIHQIFGANTDVGKTILTTALCRSTARAQKAHDPRAVFYLKPVSTGSPKDADDSHVTRFSGPFRDQIRSACLYQLNDPVSPHLAVKMATGQLDPSAFTDEEFLSKIRHHISRISGSCPASSSLYIETAGGVHSPTLSGIPQADAYRPLFLPTVLIGDARLGGISSTISAFESLLLRGYIVDAILLFKDDYYRNWEYLREYFRRKDIAVAAIRPPPPRISNPEEDRHSTELYYRNVCGEDEGSGDPEMMSVVQHLDQKHLERLDALESMPRRTLDAVWWPFVQHGAVDGEKAVTVIDSAYGDFFDTFQHRRRRGEAIGTHKDPSPPRSLIAPQFDGSASWWTQCFGHGHLEIAQAAASAAGRYGHVVFPLATHEPALTLIENLLHRGPGKDWAAKIFISDNGSTGMEVALKMAIRATVLRYPPIKKSTPKIELGVIGLKGSYHGDTIGAMDACEGGVYNSSVEWHRERGYWFEPPSVGIQRGMVVVSSASTDWRGVHDASAGMDDVSFSDAGMRCEFRGTDGLSRVYDVESRLGSSLARLYRLHISSTLEDLVRKQGRAFGALVIEPILMGAGGMIFVDPLFQRILIDVVRSRSDLWAEALDSTIPSGSESVTPPPAYPPPHDTWHGLPVIFDEVFSGLYRLGFLTSSELLRTYPDLLVLAKILTGGLLPLSVTLSSQSIYGAFWGAKKVDAMLHGHSYTAHPIGCAVANKSFELMDELVNTGEEWREAKARWGVSEDTNMSSQLPSTAHSTNLPHSHQVWSLWDPHFVKDVSLQPKVEDVMALGTVLAIRLKDDDAGYQAASSEAFLTSVSQQLEISQLSEEFPIGLHFRPLGNVAYLMSSLNTPSRVLRLLEGAVTDALKRF